MSPHWGYWVFVYLMCYYTFRPAGAKGIAKPMIFTFHASRFTLSTTAN